ncbi:alpha/beta fold hydrolase [Nocardia sp. NBC_01327]|uniref:alpha/beta fold hydrolase n=1 Tax=Nocardia sp. NBC_01327 TaxID=2903593 RepID=UPI002E101754|nr:alpha/beta hydrolase [Nocardia sp. NBC_01327]
MTESAASLPPDVRSWRESGRWMQCAAGRVFVRSGQGSGPTVLLLHGYPSSSYDFRRVVDQLGGRAWVALDFLGFGFSDKPRPHRYSLFEQADIVEEVVAGSIAGPVVVLAHDMGTSVATELLARDIEGALSFSMERVVLGNGSVILEKASLRPIQKILRGRLGPVAARLANRVLFTREFAQLFSARHPLSKDEAAAQWALLSNERGHRITDLLTAYLDERVVHAARWHGAVRDWGKPLGFLWATGDPVATTAVLDGLRALRPAAAVVELPGLGHYPQIEDPGAYAAGARRLLGIEDGPGT